ncbi:hypothetical protein DFH08DRAFT_1089352 [Mycena albidolilacea]|uniref:Uncharacterized protein n=1 Tax=Mycena albidolilacea TaxID=1033008 RepID=A0AAD6Z1D8_9AGAR|nr:hypothetical protein DFH08DRAFT_1089352 [Mycena albidolilacea]
MVSLALMLSPHTFSNGFLIPADPLCASSPSVRPSSPFPVIIPLFRPVLSSFPHPPPSTPPPAPSGKKSSRTKSRPSPPHPPHPMKRAATPAASPSAGAAALIPMCGRVSAVYEKPREIEDADEGESEDETLSHRSRTMSVPSPFAARHEYTSNTSTQERENPSPSPEPTGWFRNGSVKGMVHSFESSGSESGSPERERERRGQSEGEDDAAGGTVPVAMDLEATVRAYDHVYANGAASLAPGTTHGTNRFLKTNTANGNKELTVEELLAREDALGQPPPLQPMTPSHTDGAWRRGKCGMGVVVMPQSTGAGDPIKQHPTGVPPLSAHPSSSSSSSSAGVPHAQRTSSGVHVRGGRGRGGEHDEVGARGGAVDAASREDCDTSLVRRLFHASIHLVLWALAPCPSILAGRPIPTQPAHI